MGGNGGPDWRAMIAGEDTAAIEALARYKTPQDFYKAHNELRTKLSTRPEVPTLTEQSTPEQIAAYRKALDVPEVSKEAKDEAYAEAYGLKLPEGVDIPPSLIGAFARKMNSQHVPKKAVQAAVGEFAAIQTTIAKQASETDVTKRREWQGAMRDELGREYDAQIGSAKQWLSDQFRDNPDDLLELVGARLPSGGRLGDHPFFVKLIAQQAMGSGYTDRIEANSMESTGKSLAQQQMELEAERRKDRKTFSASGGEGRLLKIIGLRQTRGEIDEWGNEVTQKRRA